MIPTASFAIASPKMIEKSLGVYLYFNKVQAATVSDGEKILPKMK